MENVSFSGKILRRSFVNEEVKVQRGADRLCFTPGLERHTF